MKLKTATLLAACSCVILILVQVLNIISFAFLEHFFPIMLLIPILSLLGLTGLLCFFLTLHKNQK